MEDNETLRRLHELTLDMSVDVTMMRQAVEDLRNTMVSPQSLGGKLFENSRTLLWIKWLLVVLILVMLSK